MNPWTRTRTVLITGLTGILAAGLSACYGGGDGAPAQEEPAIDLAAEEAAVRQVNVTWLERFRAGDADGVAALFVEDGWTIGDAGLREGRAAILAGMAEEYGANPDATADWGAKSVWVAASGDLAVERGSWAYDSDGEGEAEGDEGEYITVFVKVGDQWMVLADAGASTMPDDEEDD
jgi:uncharacterized protein (TIGR02246 family)